MCYARLPSVALVTLKCVHIVRIVDAKAGIRHHLTRFRDWDIIRSMVAAPQRHEGVESRQAIKGVRLNKRDKRSIENYVFNRLSSTNLVLNASHLLLMHAASDAVMLVQVAA